MPQEIISGLIHQLCTDSTGAQVNVWEHSMVWKGQELRGAAKLASFLMREKFYLQDNSAVELKQ